MPIYNISPAANLDLSVIQNDSINYNFSVFDDNNQPINFSAYTSALMTIRVNEYSDELISFSSTGNTYQIDISNKNEGNFIIKCDSIQLDNGGYMYDFKLSNNENQITVMGGKFIVRNKISL